MIGASTTPSRFLQEIQLTRTQSVMETVQRLAAGDQDAVWQLKWMLNQATTQPALVNNLLTGYLVDLEKADQFTDIYGVLDLISPTVGEICEKGGWSE